MTIKIKIRRQKEMETLKKKVAVTKTLDGDLMFLNHPFITIVAKKEKVLCFAKDGNYTDDAQYLLDPPEDDVTELGEVPQEEKKGTVPTNPYITPLIYRI